jgi:diadenosine tetraphosphate (Ap4A) HIT family hydrolase
MQYNEDNVFDKIIKKEIPSQVIYEDDRVIAIYDISPKAPKHILLLPKGKFVSFDDFVTKSKEEDISYFFRKAKEIATNEGLSEYKIITNCGKSAGQEVFHFHLHIMGGW